MYHLRDYTLKNMRFESVHDVVGIGNYHKEHKDEFDRLHLAVVKRQQKNTMANDMKWNCGWHKNRWNKTLS